MNAVAEPYKPGWFAIVAWTLLLLPVGMILLYIRLIRS